MSENRFESSEPLNAEAAARFAQLALDCVHRAYPNKIAHVMTSDEDSGVPRELTPVFYGCYDWHSAVHGHWLLARLARLYPEAPFAAEARDALSASFTQSNVAGEMKYLAGEGRVSFERPYGLAWLLQLMAELREWDSAHARRWAELLAPLEAEAANRFKAWLPKLHYPIREGEHSQSAFAFGLVLDWARTAGDQQMIDLIAARSQHFYGGDRDCPMGFEPSGQDFLSPCLGEAELMRRVLAPGEFAQWLTGFLPQIPETVEEWLPPATVTDRSDPKLAHLDGLNLSRAWMLEGMASGLPETDSRRGAILAAARSHRRASLGQVLDAHYEGGHWLGSFATYLTTERGLSGADLP